MFMYYELERRCFTYVRQGYKNHEIIYIFVFFFFYYIFLNNFVSKLTKCILSPNIYNFISFATSNICLKGYKRSSLLILTNC